MATQKSVCIASCVDLSVPCGGTNRIIAFTKALIKAGFDVHLVVPKPKNQLPELKGVKLYLAPVSSRGIKTQISRAFVLSYIAKKIAEKNNSILQIEFAAVAGIASLLNCSNFVVDVHDLSAVSTLYKSLPFSRILLGIIFGLEKLAFIKSAKIITVSKPMKEYIVRRYGINEEKIYVIPNGYFKSRFNLHLNRDSSLGDDFKIVFLGTLLPKIDINKITLLAKSLKNTKIYIIGDGPVKSKLENIVKKYKLKNIVVTGRLPDIAAFKIVAESKVAIYPLKKSELTLMMSPVKLFDYAAMGKAIVMDDVNDSEVWKKFKEAKAALPSRDCNEFVNYIRLLMDDRKTEKKLGIKAKKIVENYEWEKMGEKLIKLYKEILE